MFGNFTKIDNLIIYRVTYKNLVTDTRETAILTADDFENVCKESFCEGEFENTKPLDVYLADIGYCDNYVMLRVDFFGRNEIERCKDILSEYYEITAGFRSSGEITADDLRHVNNLYKF